MLEIISFYKEVITYVSHFNKNKISTSARLVLIRQDLGLMYGKLYWVFSTINCAVLLLLVDVESLGDLDHIINDRCIWYTTDVEVMLVV